MEQLHSHYAMLVSRDDVEQKVRVTLLCQKVVFKLTVVRQEHLQEAAFLTPHLLKENTTKKPMSNSSEKCSHAHVST